MFMAHGASRPSKILQDRYLARLMAKHKRERGFTTVMSVTKLSSLCQRLTGTKFGSTVAMCVVCKGCCKKFKTNNSINRYKKLVCGKPHHRKSFFNFSMWGQDHHS